MTTWILVADSGRARLFTFAEQRMLNEVESFVCPEDRLQEHELTSDRRGRSRDSGSSSSHETEPASSHREQAAIGFAAELAERLEQLRSAGELTKLVLIAAPKFLGHLRAKLSDPVQTLVALTVDKDLTQHSTDDIAEHIPRFT